MNMFTLIHGTQKLELGFPAVSALGDAALLDAVITGALLAGASAFMPGTASSEALKAKGARVSFPRGVLCYLGCHKGATSRKASLSAGSHCPLVAMPGCRTSAQRASCAGSPAAV